MERIAFSVDETAAAIGVGRSTIYRLIEDGQLNPRKVLSRTVILAEEIDALLQRKAA